MRLHKGVFMRRVVRLILNGLTYVLFGWNPVMSCLGCDYDGGLADGESLQENGVPDKKIRFSPQVLDDFRKNVGKYRAETGGMLASTSDSDLIDKCYFDVYSQNTSGTFYYDVESMSEVFREWKARGYVTNGIYHSHPIGSIRPSYHDISTALLHLRFFELDYFYLPIFQNDRRGLYTMYFYVVRRKDDTLNVNLEYVLNANEDGYEYPPFTAWNRDFSIKQLDAYRKGIDCQDEKHEVAEESGRKTAENGTGHVAAGQEENVMDTCTGHIAAGQEENIVDTAVQSSAYFVKVRSLYPENVLDKVIIGIGVGGARSAYENFARSGFRNFILMDADVLSPSNVATQGVFISEMGRKKVDVIRQSILDINPDAKVVCVDRFLDDNMSDEEFKSYMDLFPGKKPTDYLILGCTDNFEAQKRSSVLALKYGTPYLAAMMYKAGAAAELIFVYPGVTESCPRCLLGSRFEKYENGFKNDVDSSACTIFATERMNALKGYIALMLLMYHEAPGSVFNDMLDHVKDRNFVQIRLTPNVSEALGIGIFDKVFAGAERYTFMDETVWIPQKPDHPSNGYETCKLCGGTGHLEELYMRWPDTRNIKGDSHGALSA